MNNAAKKISWNKVSTFQRIFTVVLLFLMLISSFFTYYSVPFNDSYDEFYQPADPSDEGIREISISPAVTATSIFHIVSLIQAEPDEVNAVYHSVSEGSPSIYNDAKGLAYLVVDSFEYSVIVNLHYITLMLLSIATPVFLFIILTIILKKYLKTSIYKKHFAVYCGCMSLFRVILRSVPFVFFIGFIIPQADMGPSAMLLCALCIIGAFVHMVCSHIKDYTKAQRRYRNLIQFVSLISIAVSVTFAYFSFKSNFMLRTVESLFGDITLIDITKIFSGGSFSFDEDILPLAVGVVFITALICAFRSFCNTLCRLSMATVHRKRYETVRPDAYIAKTIYPNIIAALFFLFINTDITVVFYDSEFEHFVMMISCILLTTIVEVLIVILRSIFCVDLGNGGRYAVLDGSTYASSTENYEIQTIKNNKK